MSYRKMSEHLHVIIQSHCITRLLSVYAGEADKLQRLTEIVLSHHNKDSNTWSLQVQIVENTIDITGAGAGGGGGGDGPAQD